MSKKHRISYLLATLITMLLGIASRRLHSSIFSLAVLSDRDLDFIHNYAGDALWAAMIYWGFRMVFIYFTKHKAAILSLVFCYLIEISQLYHADWIDNIRQTTLGGLVLGFGFLWSDLISYFVGVLVAWLIDLFLIKSNKSI